MRDGEAKFLAQAWETMRKRAELLREEAMKYGFVGAASMLSSDERHYTTVAMFGQSLVVEQMQNMQQQSAAEPSRGA